MALPLGRIGLSALVIVVFRFVSAIVQPIVATQLAAAAGDQFQNSDFAFVRVSSFIAMLGGVSFLCWVIPVVLLMCIWWRPVSRLIDRVMAVALVLGFLAAPQAHAYYSATDVTEAYGILPNHSAFWVPGMGDTKNNQAQMESEDFLKANKVPGKFFIIPHVKLNGSVYMGWDKYIPTGRLIVVNRAPFFHEWTKLGRGTDATSDQSFPCHSKDNIEVSAEMSLAASVTEDNAAKFLFYFGVNPPDGDPASPDVIFTSVYQGKALNQVMGGWGRGEIQSRVCREINKYSVEELGENGNKVLDNIQETAKAFFLTFGITIEYVGWAGGFSYPPEVKSAINTRFAAKHIQDVLPTLEAKAAIDALAGWDRHLPTTLTVLGGDWLSGLFATVKAAQTPAKLPETTPSKP